MAGVAITQAAEDCAEKVKALVYMCAFLPRNGDSLTTWASQDKESMVNPSTTFPVEEGVIGLNPQYIREALYADCSEEDIAYARRASRTSPPSLFGRRCKRRLSAGDRFRDITSNARSTVPLR